MQKLVRYEKMMAIQAMKKENARLEQIRNDDAVTVVQRPAKKLYVEKIVPKIEEKTLIKAEDDANTEVETKVEV